MRNPRAVALALVVLLPAGAAQAILFSQPLDPELSGFLSIKTAGMTCTAVMVADDAFLTAARCFVDAELVHPEMVGWVMGSQDSFDNPIRELSADGAGFVVGRLDHALLLNPPGKPPSRFPLYRAPIERLDGAQLDCVSFGQIANDTRPLYGDTLGRGRYSVVSRNGDVLWLHGNRLNRSDVGGACFDVARPGEVAALILDADDVRAIPLAIRREGSITRRSFVATFLTRYELVAQHSGRCLTETMGVASPSMQLQQQACRTSDDQRFRFVPAGRGSVEIRAVGSDKCLTVDGGSNADGAAIVTGTCAGDLADPLSLPTALPPEQLWTVTYVGNGRVQVSNDLTRKCLNVSRADPGEGATLVQFRCDRAATNQHWSMSAVAFSEDAHALIPVSAVVRCADVFRASTAPGAEIGLYGCHGGLNQQWQLSAVAPRFMAAMSAHTDFNLVMAGLSSRVVQLPWSAAAAQEWRFEWRLGSYAVRSRSDESRCLDVGFDGLLVERACADARGTGDPPASQRWLVE